MATNQTGIAITIKAWLPTGKTLDEQLAALTLVKTAHQTSDYAPLLAAAQIEAVQTDSKTRRVDEVVAPTAWQAETEEPEPVAEGDPVPVADPIAPDDVQADIAAVAERIEKDFHKGVRDAVTGIADPADANTAAEPKPRKRA